MSPASHERRERAAALALSLAFLALLAAPHLTRLRHPSLFSDDVPRIADLQTLDFATLLFRPFNEHVAPFFQLVSWLTWRLCGASLVRAPLAFTMASYVPFVLILSLLPRWVRSETDSPTTALAATALFALSPLYVETVYWYSASSFTWALFWTMLSLALARRPGRLGLLVTSILAPASSGIGLLAGPLATLRLWADRRLSGVDRLTIALPSLGTAAFLAGSVLVRDDPVPGSDQRRLSDLFSGATLAVRAPIEQLIPGTLGFPDGDSWMPTWLAFALAAFGFLVVMLWGAQSRERGLILAGIGLIAGGYALTYPFRLQAGPYWLFRTERYHLFPQLGLVLLIALAARPAFRRFDTARLGPLGFATVGALLLLAAQKDRFAEQTRLYTFPDQPRTLAAMERLGRICREEGVGRAALRERRPAVWCHWFQSEFNGLTIVPAPIEGTAAPRTNLLAKLTPEEREALWGGMDATPYAATREPATESTGAGALIAADRVACTWQDAPPGLRNYTSTGQPAFLEFAIPPWAEAEPPRALVLPAGPYARPLEIWWTGEDGRWSPLRSIRLRTGGADGPREWSIPLDRLPHWRADRAARLRVYLRMGTVALGPPRLAR